MSLFPGKMSLPEKISLVPSFSGPRTITYPPFTTADELLETPFHHCYHPATTVVTKTSTFDIHVDWNETPHAYVLKIHLPGWKKEDVNVEVEEGRVLKISGERNAEFEDKNGRWHGVERRRPFHLEPLSDPSVKRADGWPPLSIGGSTPQNASSRGMFLADTITERSVKFLKRVQLPENANVEQIKAKMVNGELTIIVPKMTHRRFVEISD